MAREREMQLPQTGAGVTSTRPYGDRRTPELCTFNLYWAPVKQLPKNGPKFPSGLSWAVELVER